MLQQYFLFFGENFCSLAHMRQSINVSQYLINLDGDEFGNVNCITVGNTLTQPIHFRKVST